MNAKKYLTSWPSSNLFVLAAIGSAAGLGNVWRFPYLAYEYGGAAFFFAYLVCLAFIGFPLLLSENALGQKTGKSAPGAMESLAPHGRWRVIGFWGIFAAIGVMSYYSVIISWTGNYLISSFDMPWQENAKDYFFNTVLHISDSVSSLGSFVPHLLLGLAITWIILYFVLFRGMQSVSKVITYITPLPFFLLLFLAINGLSLEGSSQGVLYFLLPKWEQLLHLDLWIAAASQVFFTLTLGFGVMFAYGALLSQKVDLIKTTTMIIIGDTIVALVAGISIFSTLGNMALQKGVPLPEVVANGPGLAFVVFPEALSMLPFGASIFSFFFFLTLLTLALTSAISLVQASLSVLGEYFPQIKYQYLVFATCSVLFLLSLPYALQGGLYLLDIVDHFLVNYGIILVGLIEIIVIGWIGGGTNIQKWVNKYSSRKLGPFFLLLLRYIIPGILLILISINIIQDIRHPYEGYPSPSLLFFGIFPVVLILFLALIFGFYQKKEEK